MSQQPSREAIDHAFVQIERAAVRGERCPLNGDGNVDSRTVMVLALEGRIRVHIHGKNFRQVVILTGIHAGKWTASDPQSGRLWVVIDHNGKRRIRRGEKPAEQPIRFTELKPDKPNAPPCELSG